jgi:S-formylglutathione hydrolase FrmB
MPTVRRPRRFALAALALCAACATRPAVEAPAAGGGTIVHDTVRSAALRGNLLGDAPDRPVAVYLPPGYAASGRRYPVVYLLHGFDGGPRQWTERFGVGALLDSLLAAGAARPMIAVMPDARNAYGGSFFVNSPVAGRWADFAAGDLVRHVDRRWRTVRGPEGRAVAGWSMGGYGALRLAAAHPEVFGAVYALSPCCLGPELVDEVWRANPAWKTTLALGGPPGTEAELFWTRLQLALAAVLSPAPERPPLYVALPFAARGDSLVPVDSVLARWTAESPRSFVARHAAGLRRLRGIAFDAGGADGFRHILVHVRQLAAALDSAGIVHTSELYEGTHGSRVRERLRTHVFPFLSARLAEGDQAFRRSNLTDPNPRTSPR